MTIVAVQNRINNQTPSFKMKFRLRPETKKCIEKRTGKTIKELRNKPLNLHYGNIRRSEKHDIIYPRNVYLQQGRVDNPKEVAKVIDEFGKPKSKLERLLTYIKQIF